MSAEPASSPENAQAFALALEKLRNSEAFKGSGRALGLLGFLVERTLAGDPLKEFTVGAEGLGRGAKFDPRFDSIVRVEVSRLRNRLAAMPFASRCRRARTCRASNGARSRGRRASAGWLRWRRAALLSWSRPPLHGSPHNAMCRPLPRPRCASTSISAARLRCVPRKWAARAS
jgi:hypothetical protein